MVRPIKQKQIPNLQEAIKETAWKQIAEAGAPALSLRAIARELKITAPAIYNYFPDRDALVTALIIDAFTSFGDWQLKARDSVPEEDLSGRMNAIGLAYRDWAHTFPQRYKISFEAWKTYGGNADILSLSVAMIIWARVHGIVSLEIAGNLPPFGAKGDALYRYELQSIHRQF